MFLSVSVLELEGPSDDKFLCIFLGENVFDFLLGVHLILILTPLLYVCNLLVEGCGVSFRGDIINFYKNNNSYFKKNEIVVTTFLGFSDEGDTLVTLVEYSVGVPLTFSALDVLGSEGELVCVPRIRVSGVGRIKRKTLIGDSVESVFALSGAAAEVEEVEGSGEAEELVSMGSVPLSICKMLVEFKSNFSYNIFYHSWWSVYLHKSMY